MAKPSDLVFFVQVQTQYNITEIVATVMRKSDSEGITGPGWDQAEFENFAVSAYVGSTISRDEGDSFTSGIWGSSVAYRDMTRVVLRESERQVKVLRKVERGLTKLAEAEGYLPDADYAGFLFRVARVLGITEYWVRNTSADRDIHGYGWARPSSAYGIQSLVREALEAKAHTNSSS
jgi:hypothetical protein